VTIAAGLDALLSRDLQAQRAAERTAFDRLSGGRPLVLMGAGGLGRRTLAGLRRDGLEPLAFADNSASRQGTLVDGLMVLSPADAARHFGERAAFVVTIWGANSPHRFAHSQQQLRALGCDVVLPFPPLFWRHAESLLPFYLQDLPSHLLEQKSDVLRALALWEDNASRDEYLAQIRFRLDADFDGLSHPVEHPQYFPSDLFAWSDDEWIVDAGAYDGDTIQTIVRQHGDHFRRILALEPDPANCRKLRALVDSLPPSTRAKIECQQLAVASASGLLHIDATGTAASATSGQSSEHSVAVRAAPLDLLLGDARPTFMKFDIEGAEVDALTGARGTIERQAPILAVCVYHQQDHLWRIPLLLREWRTDYALFLRPHNEEGWDLVCYAVPRERLKRAPR